MTKVLNLIDYGDSWVVLRRLEDSSYLVERYDGAKLIAKETTTGYDDALVHFHVFAKAAKKQKQEG
jgi:hypothetical protein